MTGTLEVAIAVRPPADDGDVAPLGAARTAHATSVRGEREIAIDLAAGDPSALEAAFRRWADLVHGVARTMVGTQDADDVTQQVYVRAWRSHSSFDPTRGEVPGWLVGITRNVARDHLRSKAPDSLELVTDLDGDPGPPEQDDVVNALLVASALRDLPDAQRTVLELTLLHDLTQTETADHLGIPLGTVKTRHRRGIQRLRDRMGGHDHA